MIEDMMFLLSSNMDIYLLDTLFKVPSSVLDKIDHKDMEKSHLEVFEDQLFTILPLLVGQHFQIYSLR